MSQEKDYYAFISYKREDEKWAKWLQDKLEHYKFPANLNGRTDLPKNIRPTFRDVTDLKPGLLAEEINNALCNSEWLIVVCSPRSAKSPWVCKEAQSFIDLGRANHIIPFVIEGNPFSNDATTECYPEALLNLIGSKELLAANINEMGRDAAAVKVVARMFNLRFDSLWQRYEREQRQKRWIIIGGAILLTLLSIGTGSYFFKQNMTIEKQNFQLEDAAKHLREDSLALANHIFRIQKDSVLLSLQKDSIQNTNKLLKSTIETLAQANMNLREANSQILRERSGMLAAQSRAVAEKAKGLIDAGDSYTARLLALEILPKNLSKPNRPYTPEAEYILRKSLDEDNMIINDEVNYAVYNHQGNLFATCSENKIKVWDAYTGQLIKKIEEGGSYINNVSFSNDDSKLYTASYDNTIKAWDIATGKSIYTAEGHIKPVNSVEMSPNGLYLLSSSEDNTVKIWDAATGEMIRSTTRWPSDYAKGSFSADRSFFINIVSNNTYRVDSINGGHKLYRANLEWLSNCAISKDGNLVAFSSEASPTVKVVDTHSHKDSLTLNGHSDGVMSIAFSPDNNYLLSASKDRTLKKWDLKVGKKIFTTKKWHTNIITCLAYSPNGKFFVSGSTDDSIIIWNSETGGILKILKGHYGDIGCVVISPDSKFIASASADKTVRIWEVETGNVTHVLRGHTDEITSLSFNNEGSLLASSSQDGTIRIWNARNGNLLSEVKDLIDRIKSLAFSIDGREIYALQKTCFTQHDVETGKFKTLTRWFVSNSSFAVYSPNGRFIATPCEGNMLLLLDASSLNVIKYLVGHDDEVSSAAFSPDGTKIITGSNDHTLRLWNVETGENIKVFKGHTDNISNVHYSHNGQFVVSASNDSTIRVWDVDKGTQIKLFKSPTGGCYSVYFNNDDSSILSTSYYNIRQWATPNFLYKKTLQIESDSNHKFIISPNRQFIASQDDANIRIYDINANHIQTIYSGYQNSLVDGLSMSFNPTGDRIATSYYYDHTIKIWDAFTGKRIKTIEANCGVTTVCFSSSGKNIIAGFTNGTIGIWDICDNITFKKTIDGGSGHILSVIGSPNGKYVACNTDYNNFKIWDVETGIQKLSLNGFFSPTSSFSPDENLIAVEAPDHLSIFIYNINTGALVTILKGSHEIITQIDFSPNGKYLLSASGDGVIRIWDVNTGVLLKEIVEENIGFLSFLSNEYDFISISRNGNVKIWELAPLQELINQTRKRYKNRSLLPYERHLYYLE